MQYFKQTTTRHSFVVIPQELRMILNDLHHVVVDTGVSKEAKTELHNFYCITENHITIL